MRLRKRDREADNEDDGATAYLVFVCTAVCGLLFWLLGMLATIWWPCERLGAFWLAEGVGFVPLIHLFGIL